MVNKYSITTVISVIFVISILVNGSYSLAASCSASPNNCAESCTAVAPAGGSADCYEDDNFAECTAMDANGNITDTQEINCPNGGGGGGGSGSTGGGPGCVILLGCWPWLY